ncbi:MULTISPECIES: TIGR00730 family Rossman fold protein [unclassified Campylobacter]|uniref:LOG family protein n=1 Tax=unclassified Campylobacter TaxID=2593542 RepID=UPI003D34EA8B
MQFLEEFRSFRQAANFENKAVTLFGSARLELDSFHCQKAREVAKKLSENGIAVLTGGGDGVMGAANMGASEGGAPSVAFNIRLPFEQATNPYATHSFLFTNFSPRKFALIERSVAFVVFAGGFGTLDELFEVLVLVQTGMKDAKIFLVGEQFWKPLDEFIKTTLIDEKLISKDDVKFYTITDDVEFIVSEILRI